MDKIIDLQRNKVDSLYQSLDDLITNLDKASNFDSKSLSNFIDKLRLMNKSIDSIKDDINELLIDLKNNGCKLNAEITQRLDDEEETSRMIQEMAPLILYYQLNRLNSNTSSNITEPEGQISEVTTTEPINDIQ